MIKLAYKRYLEGWRFYYEAPTIVGKIKIHKKMKPQYNPNCNQDLSGWVVTFKGKTSVWLSSFLEAENHASTLVWEHMRQNWKGPK